MTAGPTPGGATGGPGAIGPGGISRDTGSADGDGQGPSPGAPGRVAGADAVGRWIGADATSPGTRLPDDDPGAGPGLGGRGTGSGGEGPVATGRGAAAGAGGQDPGALAAFDAVVEAAAERLRGNPAADTAARALSNLADYGFAWAVVAAVKGRRRGPARRRAVGALALAGVASYGVNRAVKASVQRVRPDGADRAGGVRTPTSSSFPSGHTLAACCTAVLLAGSPGETAAYLTFATAVAASRVHLRAHHASDVVGGAVIGTALGVAGRRLLPRRR